MAAGVYLALSTGAQLDPVIPDVGNIEALAGPTNL